MGNLLDRLNDYKYGEWILAALFAALFIGLLIACMIPVAAWSGAENEQRRQECTTLGGHIVDLKGGHDLCVDDDGRILKSY